VRQFLDDLKEIDLASQPLDSPSAVAVAWVLELTGNLGSLSSKTSDLSRTDSVLDS
jgi:hypothetical protein